MSDYISRVDYYRGVEYEILDYGAFQEYLFMDCTYKRFYDLCYVIDGLIEWSK